MVSYNKSIQPFLTQNICTQTIRNSFFQSLIYQQRILRIFNYEQLPLYQINWKRHQALRVKLKALDSQSQAWYKLSTCYSRLA
ncbi:hypothetical protein FGO68_gene16658 [Halteria grandinella]|uniref:Uncharacterized protein n=1 Tax=Halteria grandinella TaxID=5974 RepID=A0A8J8NAT0_HALGN|nr:hypothetical protein FGO68_gene16658 [Halteria grandinella]